MKQLRYEANEIHKGISFIEKRSRCFRICFFFLAEQEGFEPSVPFWGTHDFQSCPL